MIRPAVNDDADALTVLMQQLGYEIRKEEVGFNLHLYEKMNGLVFVAVEDEQVVAFISGVFVPLFHVSELMFRITALCVAEHKRTMGIGRSLVNKMEELCRKKDCFYLEVTSGAHR